MSETTADTDEGDESAAPAPVKVLRTVTPIPRGKADPDMDAVGWSIFLGLVVLLFPLLPLLAVVWLVTKLLDALQGRAESE